MVTIDEEIKDNLGQETHKAGKASKEGSDREYTLSIKWLIFRICASNKGSSGPCTRK